MPIEIKINGATANEAVSELKSLAGLMRDTAVLAVAEEVPAGEEKTFPEVKKRARPARTEAAPIVSLGDSDNGTGGRSAPVAKPEADASDEEPFTLDDARKALADLLAQPDGKTKAQGIFADFEIKQISQLPTEKYKAFIAAIAGARGL